VVVRRTQERLEDGTAHELLDRRIVREQVPQRVRLALDPEPVPALDIVGDAVGRRLTGADDHLVVERGDRPRTVAEATGEEVVPGDEAPMLILGIVPVLLDPDRAARRVAFPSRRRIVEHTASRGCPGTSTTR